MNGFNVIIRELRKETGITQKEVAKTLGISTTCYAGYEQGGHEPSFETLIKLANYFDVSTDYLLGLAKDDGLPHVRVTSPEALSFDELELLKNYRTLSYVGKARVTAYVDFMREQENTDMGKKGKS